MQDKQQIIEITKKLMAQVNAECFNNALTFDFPIKLSNSGKVAGSVEVWRRKFLGETTYKITNLKISKNFDWSEQDLKNVVAHELIHIYECQVLKIQPSHGAHFQAKKNQINQNPDYQVTTRHSMKTTKVKKPREVVFVLSEDSTTICILSRNHLFGVQNNPRIAQIFGQGYKTGLITADKVKPYRVQSKLRYTQKITPEKLQHIGLE